MKQIQNDLLVQKSKPIFHGGGSKVNRPGELYKRYRTVEELPEMAKAFYEVAGKFTLVALSTSETDIRAASNVGISLKMLVRGVFQHEVKLESWIVTERNKEKAESISAELMEGDA